MLTRAAESGLLWDLAAGEAVQVSRRWVLSAMQRHGEMLVGMLWRILGNEQDVCDAYQETFLRLTHYEHGDGLDGAGGNRPSRPASRPDNVKAYLFRTGSNIAISMLRKRQCRQRAYQALADATRSSKVTDHVAEVDLQYLQDELRTQIARLPERLQSVVVLRDLAELPYGRVAEILGVSPGAARVYRYRALRLLAARMAHAKDK